MKAGTRIPLVLVNGISTKNSHEGDQVYLQTAFPIAVESRIVIPEGSYVTGTVTQVKRPGSSLGMYAGIVPRLRWAVWIAIGLALLWFSGTGRHARPQARVEPTRVG